MLNVKTRKTFFSRFFENKENWNNKFCMSTKNFQLYCRSMIWNTQSESDFCPLQLFQAGFLTLTMHGFHETKKKNKSVGNDLPQIKI